MTPTPVQCVCGQVVLVGVTCSSHSTDDIDRATYVLEQTVLSLRDERLIASLRQTRANAN